MPQIPSSVNVDLLLDELQFGATVKLLRLTIAEAQTGLDFRNT